jgi:3-oxoacyl-[acyl-carrier-protein] synthase III
VQVEGVYINGLGVFLPHYVSSEEAIAQGLYDEDVYQGTGLTGTHVARDIPPLTMAVHAAKQALARSGNDVGTIDTLIHSGNPAQGPVSASYSGYVLRQLGGSDVHTMEISQGCSGVFGAIEVGIGFLTGAAGMQTALITTAESVETPLLDRWRGYGPGVIMGDGAAALTLSAEGGFARIVSMASSTLSEFEHWHRGNESMLPQQDEKSRMPNMVQRTMDFLGTGISLPEIIEMLSKFSMDVCHRALDDAGVRPEDLARAIANNSDGRMLYHGFMKPLGLPMERSTYDYGRGIGHMGSCDQIVSLDHLLTSDQLKPDDYVMMLTQGPGMVTSCLVIQILEVPSWTDGPVRPDALAS